VKLLPTTRSGLHPATCTSEKGRASRLSGARKYQNGRPLSCGSSSLGNSRLRSLYLLGLSAAGDGIENGIPRLLDRRDGIVDRDAALANFRSLCRLSVINADVTVAVTQVRLLEIRAETLHLANRGLRSIALSNQSGGVFHEHDTR
jgi:hypothetical protein